MKIRPEGRNPIGGADPEWMLAIVMRLLGYRKGDGASEEKRVKNTGSSGGPDFRMSDDERLRSGRLGASNNIWTYLDKKRKPRDE